MNLGDQVRRDFSINYFYLDFEVFNMYQQALMEHCSQRKYTSVHEIKINFVKFSKMILAKWNAL